MSHPVAPPQRGWIDALLVAALGLLALALFPQAALVVDSGRDLATALAITHGDAFPVYGPSLNGTWQLGPAWYYLLAALLALGGSVGATATLVGVLAAAKVPLAFLLGRGLQGPALGLACAAAVALPGWSTLGQLVLSHTSLVESAVLATLCLALHAWRTDSRGAGIGAAAMLGLALHAHPTALVAAPAVAWALWRLSRAHRSTLTLALGALLAFALPLLPMLVAQSAEGWPQWSASAGYFGQGDYGARAARAPAVLWGATAGSVAFVHALLARWPEAALAAALLLGVGLLTAAAGLLRTWRSPLVRAAFGLAVVGGLGVLLLRDTTPAWMTYACAPLGALLLALGWTGLAPAPHRGAVARGAAMAAVGISLLVVLDRVAATRAGVQLLPGAAIGDIARRVALDPEPRFWLAAWGHDAIARELCGDATPVALHGDLAAALHFGQGVAVSLHCHATQEVRLGGEAPRHVLGIPRAVARQLGLAHDARSWGFVLLGDARAVYPARGLRVTTHTRYVADDFRPLLARPGTPRLRMRPACANDELLVMTNLLPVLNQPFEVDPDGGPALPTPRAATFASRYYECPETGRLRLGLSITDPSAVDLVLVRPAP